MINERERERERERTLGGKERGDKESLEKEENVDMEKIKRE